MRIIDLTLPLTTNMPVYAGDPAVRITKVHNHTEHGWELRELQLGSHTGTHVDAFSHMHEGAPSLSDIPLTRFCGIAQVVTTAQPLPQKIGLLFNETLTMAHAEQLLTAQPNFIAGDIDEALERFLLAKRIITYTNLINIDQIGTQPCQFFGLPLAIKNGDGSPVRAIAIVQD